MKKNKIVDERIEMITNKIYLYGIGIRRNLEKDNKLFGRKINNLYLFMFSKLSIECRWKENLKEKVTLILGILTSKWIRIVFVIKC